jgi:hypothetical protein
MLDGRLACLMLDGRFQTCPLTGSGEGRHAYGKNQAVNLGMKVLKYFFKSIIIRYYKS